MPSSRTTSRADSSMTTCSRSPSACGGEEMIRMKDALRTSGLLVTICLSLPARAQEDKQDISLGLAPGTPQVGALPGGVTPAYGQRTADEGDWRFDFHGFLTMP